MEGGMDSKIEKERRTDRGREEVGMNKQIEEGMDGWIKGWIDGGREGGKEVGRIGLKDGWMDKGINGGMEGWMV